MIINPNIFIFIPLSIENKYFNHSKMKKFVKLFALFLMSVFCSSCGQSQANVLQDTIKPNSVLYAESLLREADSSKVPMSMVRNVRQARNGDILVASYFGVFRFDGISFTNITSTISSPSFWDVLEDRKGNLWFGTRDSGVYLQPAGQTTFQHFTTKDGLASNYGALHLYEDKAGNIWFGTVNGAYRYDGKTLRSFTTKDGLPNNDINTIMEDNTGKLWFGTRGEACFYDGKTFTVLKNKDGKTFNNVWSIIEDKRGSIWFGANDSLWRYDPSASLRAGGSTFTNVSPRGAYAIIQDKKGNIWTTGGTGGAYSRVWALSRYDAESLYHEKPNVTEIKSSDELAFLGLLEANDGSIWFGSAGPNPGVHRYDGKTVMDFKSKVWLKYTSGVRSILEDSKGNIWFGSYNEGVCLLQNGNFQYFTIENGLSDNQVRSIYEDKNGTIWFECGMGISVYDGQKMTVYKERNYDAINEWKLTDSDLWFKGDETVGYNKLEKHAGLYQFDGKKLQYRSFPIEPKLGKENVYSVSTPFINGKNGTVWFGTYSAVIGYDGKQFKIFDNDALGLNGTTESLHIRCIMEDSKGNLWIGNNSGNNTIGGIGVIKYDGNKFTYFTKQLRLRREDTNGNCLDRVFSMCEDSSGNIWFGTVESGVWRYDGQTMTNFTKKDGLDGDMTWIIYKSKSGELWFGGGSNGVFRFNGKSFEREY
jgi:ligand-binding sensor domain-containing protein